MPVSLNGPLPASYPMPPPPPPSVDQLRQRATLMAHQLQELHMLWSVTSDPDVLDSVIRLSRHYNRILTQLSAALERERQNRPETFGSSFANI